jgi:hypothetical protein
MPNIADSTRNAQKGIAVIEGRSSKQFCYSNII